MCACQKKLLLLLLLVVVVVVVDVNIVVAIVVCFRWDRLVNTILTMFDIVTRNSFNFDRISKFTF